MRPIRRRQDVLDIAALNAPSRACAAAMESSLCQTLLLGSFTAVEGFPGWIVKVTSLYKKTWLIAVLVNEVDRTTPIRYIEEVPWATWAGDSAGKNQLRDGDIPRIAAYERMKADASQVQSRGREGRDPPGDADA